MLKIVIDTNIWIRALLADRITIPILEAWHVKLCEKIHTSSGALHQIITDSPIMMILTFTHMDAIC